MHTSNSEITRLINCPLNVCLGFLHRERVKEMAFDFTVKIKRWVLTGPLIRSLYDKIKSGKALMILSD